MESALLDSLPCYTTDDNWHNQLGWEARRIPGPGSVERVHYIRERSTAVITALLL